MERLEFAATAQVPLGEPYCINVLGRRVCLTWSTEVDENGTVVWSLKSTWVPSSGS